MATSCSSSAAPSSSVRRAVRSRKASRGSLSSGPKRARPRALSCHWPRPALMNLGRSGLSGTIDRHWWLRFGTAILITVIDGAIQGATESHGNGGTIVLNPSTSSDVATEVLRGTLNIPPTIDKAQGDRIEILVARDVDFRSVYALHASAGRALMDGQVRSARQKHACHRPTAPRPAPSTFRARGATLIARADLAGLAAAAIAPGGDRDLHQSTRRGFLGDPNRLGAGDAARLRTFIGVIGSRSSSRMPRASESPRNLHFCRRRFRR